MYSFYEKIKKEVDLKDLYIYLEEPLKHIDLLQNKLDKLTRKNKVDRIIPLMFQNL